jgi:hypothetical protein
MIVVPAAALKAWSRKSSSEETMTVGPVGGDSGGQASPDLAKAARGDEVGNPAEPWLTNSHKLTSRRIPLMILNNKGLNLEIETAELGLQFFNTGLPSKSGLPLPRYIG